MEIIIGDYDKYPHHLREVAAGIYGSNLERSGESLNKLIYLERLEQSYGVRIIFENELVKMLNGINREERAKWRMSFVDDLISSREKRSVINNDDFYNKLLIHDMIADKIPAEKINELYSMFLMDNRGLDEVIWNFYEYLPDYQIQTEEQLLKLLTMSEYVNKTGVSESIPRNIFKKRIQEGLNSLDEKTLKRIIRNYVAYLLEDPEHLDKMQSLHFQTILNPNYLKQHGITIKNIKKIYLSYLMDNKQLYHLDTVTAQLSQIYKNLTSEEMINLFHLGHTTDYNGRAGHIRTFLNRYWTSLTDKKKIKFSNELINFYGDEGLNAYGKKFLLESFEGISQINCGTHLIPNK